MIATFLLACVTAVGLGGVPEGSSKIDVEAGPGFGRLEVFTYKPESFRDGPMLVVIHGTDRNASEYRDDARAAADRLGVLVVAPKFDRERFKGERFHRAGLLRGGAVAPRSAWTWNAVARVVDDVRRREGRPDMPYDVFGHSAGGQFLIRTAGFAPLDARRVVIANPSAYLDPSRSAAFPYGFGGLPGGFGDDDQIRRYLAQPLTIYLGTDDVLSEDLDQSPGANRQGKNRYQRGRNIFCRAEETALARGWPFGWRLVEARGVGHDHTKMLNAPEFAEALFGPPAARGRDRDRENAPVDRDSQVRSPRPVPSPLAGEG